MVVYVVKSFVMTNVCPKISKKFPLKCFRTALPLSKARSKVVASCLGHLTPPTLTSTRTKADTCTPSSTTQSTGSFLKML